MNATPGIAEGRAAAAAEQTAGRQTITLPQPGDREAMAAAVRSLTEKNASERLWSADPTLFTPDASHEKSIRSRLGWLRSPALMQSKVTELQAFTAEVRAAGFQR